MRKGRGIAVTIVAAVIVVVIVVAAAGAYFLISSKSSSSSTTSTAVPETTTTTTSTSSASSSTSATSSATASSLSSATSSSVSSSLSASTTLASTSCNTNTSNYFALLQSENQDVVPLLSAYSSMAVEYNSTSGGTANSSQTVTISYETIHESSTTYKVNMTINAGVNASESLTVWLLKNGTLLALDEAGLNLTGSMAQALGSGIFTAFIFEIGINSNLNIYTSSTYFHSTGTSQVTIGSVKMTVTDYAANALPETLSECGSTWTLSAYNLAEGTPPGASAPIVTYAYFVGSSNSTSTTSGAPFETTIQLLSFTVA